MSRRARAAIANADGTGWSRLVWVESVIASSYRGSRQTPPSFDGYADAAIRSRRISSRPWIAFARARTRASLSRRHCRLDDSRAKSARWAALKAAAEVCCTNRSRTTAALIAMTTVATQAARKERIHLSTASSLIRQTIAGWQNCLALAGRPDRPLKRGFRTPRFRSR